MDVTIMIFDREAVKTKKLMEKNALKTTWSTLKQWNPKTMNVNAKTMNVNANVNEIK